jgi:hypothetical protein
MENPLPLEIRPWWSGVYALHDVYRAGGEGNTSDKKFPQASVCLSDFMVYN